VNEFLTLILRCPPQASRRIVARPGNQTGAVLWFATLESKYAVHPVQRVWRHFDLLTVLMTSPAINGASLRSTPNMRPIRIAMTKAADIASNEDGWFCRQSSMIDVR
jgi:hypothetical protein